MKYINDEIIGLFQAASATLNPRVLMIALTGLLCVTFISEKQYAPEQHTIALRNPLQVSWRTTKRWPI